MGTILTLDPELDEAAAVALLADPAAGLAAFRAAASRAVAAGADAVIPAESILATLVARHALYEQDGAAVLDAVAIPAAFAEMVVTLHRRAGLRTGRRWHMPLAPDGLLEQLLSCAP